MSVSQESVSLKYVSQMSVSQNFSWPNVCRLMVCWPKVCQPNVCSPNVCRTNIRQPNVCWRNVCQPNVCQKNVCRWNICWPNVWRPNVFLPKGVQPFINNFEIREDQSKLLTSCEQLKREGGASSDFADEESFEWARRVVPAHALAVAVPHLQTVFLLSVLVSGMKNVFRGCIHNTSR